MSKRLSWWRSRASFAWIAGTLVLTALFSVAGAGSVRAAPSAPAAPQSAASDLQATLDNLLSEHADLAMLAMQKGYDGAPDFMAAAGQLGQNTDALSAAIGSVYGADAATKFKALWTAHIGFFVDYVTAVKGNDAAKKQAALTSLAGYKGDIAAFLSGANPNLPNAAVQQTFQAHIDQLIGTFDAYVAKDYAKTYTSYHEAHDHMFMAGGTLAGAIAKQMPQKFAGDTTSGAASLQVTLDNLLSEHAELAMLAMQKGFAGAPDFMAAAGQLGKNTDALSAAIGSVYGADAAAKFKALWTAHIGFFVDYVTAVKGNDAAKKQAALTSLGGYKGDIAAFLSGANPNLPNAAVQQTFQAHIDQLIGAFDAFVAKDYAKTYTSFHEAHDHMFMAGATLAGAIAKQMPQKFADTAAAPAAGAPAAGAPAAGAPAAGAPAAGAPAAGAPAAGAPAAGSTANMQLPGTGTAGSIGQTGSAARLTAVLEGAIAAIGIAGAMFFLSRRFVQR